MAAGDRGRRRLARGDRRRVAERRQRRGGVPGGTGRWSLRYDTRTLLVCGATALLTACVLVLALGTGAYALTPAEVVRTLAGSGPPGAGFIVTGLRLPRTLVAVLWASGWAWRVRCSSR